MVEGEGERKGTKPGGCRRVKRKPKQRIEAICLTYPEFIVN
jgi:hypothetical protein